MPESPPPHPVSWPSPLLLAAVVVVASACAGSDTSQLPAATPATAPGGASEAGQALQSGPQASPQSPAVDADPPRPRHPAHAFVDAILGTEGSLDDPGRRDEVLAALEARLAERPGDSSLLAALGLLLCADEVQVDEDGELAPSAARALGLLQAAVEGDPGLAAAHRQLAAIYEITDPSRAAAAWEQVLAVHPDDLAVRTHLGEEYIKSGQFERARTLANGSLRIARAAGDDEATRKALNTLGTSYIETGDFPRAESLLKEALVKPDGTHWNCAYQALGTLYARVEGKPGGPGAEVAAPVPEPGDAHALFRAAVHHYHDGGRAEARGYIDQALSLEARGEFQVVLGFLLLGDKDIDGAARLFEQAHRARPDDPGPRVGLGHVALSRRNEDEAERQLAPALDQWLATEVASAELPVYYDLVHRLACLGMGWLSANRNQHDRAIRFFDRVLAHRPYDLLGRIGKGNSLMGLGLMDQAEDELNQVLQLDPGNPYAMAELSAIQLSRGEVDAAEEGFRAALEAGGREYTCPYEGLGLVYLKRGRLEEARSHFERAIELGPDIEYKKYNGLAEIYMQEGRLDEARRLLLKSKDNYPYDGRAEELLARIEEMRAGGSPGGR